MAFVDYNGNKVLNFNTTNFKNNNGEISLNYIPSDIIENGKAIKCNMFTYLTLKDSNMLRIEIDTSNTDKGILLVQGVKTDVSPFFTIISWRKNINTNSMTPTFHNLHGSLTNRYDYYNAESDIGIIDISIAGYWQISILSSLPLIRVFALNYQQ